MISETVRCCVEVPTPGLFCKWHQCRRNSVIQVDGKGYCKQHSPEEKEKRYQKTKAKWDANSTMRWQERQAWLLVKRMAEQSVTSRSAFVEAAEIFKETTK